MTGNILILGEYPSQRDIDLGGLFQDGNGKMLKALLHQVGINPRNCDWDSVIREPISWAKIVGPKAHGIPNLKPVGTKYVRAEHEATVHQLWDRINRRQPRIIIAVGELAMWATTSHTGIDAARGRISQSHAGIPGLKVLPTYAPRTISMDYPKKPIFLMDLAKAERESHFPEFRRPQRFIHVNPTLADMEDFFNEYIAPCEVLSVDIEVKGYKERAHNISCIGFAPSIERALVVPFFTEDKRDGNYWGTIRDELLAWAFVRRVLRAGKETGGQNYQYDVQHLWRGVGIPNPDFNWDTMLMHHSLQPELEKGLGFLASIYTDEPTWKGMHKSTVKGMKRE